MTYDRMRAHSATAVLLPYWTFWEASAGGATFRTEREGMLADVVAALGDAGASVVWQGLIDSSETGEAAAREIEDSGADVVLVVQSMAVPPTYTTAALDRLLELPVVVWAAQRGTTLRPEFDAWDITRMGATVGTPMLTNVLGRQGRPYELIVGAQDDGTTLDDVVRAVRAGAVARAVGRARIARVGVPIAGYACVDVDGDHLNRATGIELVSVHPAEIRNLYREATDIDGLEAEVAAAFDVEVEDADVRTRSLRLAAALERLDREQAFDAGAMNCHVQEIRFGDEPGITPCFGLGRETTRGIPWTCAGDVVTAVAMLVVKRLSGAALYHEVEAIDFDTGEVVLANSGEHDLNWCTDGTRPRLQLNPWFASDAMTGASAWFELPSGPATLVGFTPHHTEPSGFRLIAAEGDVTARSFPDSPSVGGAFRFSGEEPVEKVWQRWVEAGVNHHSAAGPGRFADQVAAIARFLRIGFRRVS
ncbi:MAG: hypothetical protein IH942_07740 [Acidobacteria bacterium]|nr:hypothetical protein [Acidobacteriota bacterium]